MRVLLAGSVNADGAINTEIENYLIKSHHITVNTHFLSDNEKENLRKKYHHNTHIEFCNFSPASEQEFKKVITEHNKGYDAIIYPPNEEGFTPEVLQAALNTKHKLKVIGCPNDSLSHFNPIKKLAEENNVQFIKPENIHGRPVAEYTLMQILVNSRNLINNQEETAKGNWNHHQQVSDTHTILGKTIGVIGGSGKDGIEVIKLARAFGLKVVGLTKDDDHDGRRTMREAGAEIAISLDDLLNKSDFISVNCRRDHSIDLINANNIKNMKKGVVIINPSGADIINKEALLKEMSLPSYQRTIGIMIFDMPYGEHRDSRAFTQDPDNSKLEEMGVKFTSRSAGYTAESRQQAVRQIAKKVNMALEGKYNDKATGFVNPDGGGKKPGE